MAVIIKPNRSFKHVKNLGWLIAHWRDVECFEVETSGTVCLRVCGESTEPIEELYEKSADCVLVARLKGGSAYATAFGSADVLLNWLHRAVFFGLRVDWFGVDFILEQNSVIHKKARRGSP